MPGILDLTGKKYGRLFVSERSDDRVQPSGRHCVMWKCVCDCGNTSVVSSSNLTSGRTVSCGCFKKEKLSADRSTHGETNTRSYAIWLQMRNRCYNSNVKHYNRYGGRGIHVCDDWRYSYEKFRNWALDNGYNDTLSIDRIDNDGDYCPSNCRWTDSRSQSNNRSSNRIIVCDNEAHTVTEWARIKDINPKTLFNRIYSGWDIQAALNK